MGTNTSDVVAEQTGSGLKPSCMEANAQSSIPIVDILLPSDLGDHITMPHVNLSISGYESDSLRTSGLRSPPVRAQEVSTISQLDQPGSLPTRDPTRGRGDRFLDQVEQDPSQGGTYVWRTLTGRRREYPRGESDSDGYRRLHKDQRSPDRGYQGGRPLIEVEGPLEEDILIEVGDPLEEDTLVGDPLMKEEGLLMEEDFLEDKDHQALKDLLGL